MVLPFGSQGLVSPVRLIAQAFEPGPAAARSAGVSGAPLTD